jgi:hypothetical protein
MTRRFFLFLWVFLLIFAQHGALVHATWHAAGSGKYTYDGQARDGGGDVRSCRRSEGQPRSPAAPISQGSPCAFDLAFGQVLGGVHGYCAPPVVAALPAAHAAYRSHSRLGAEAVPALSRGPPVLL